MRQREICIVYYRLQTCRETTSEESLLQPPSPLSLPLFLSFSLQLSLLVLFISFISLSRWFSPYLCPYSLSIFTLIIILWGTITHVLLSTLHHLYFLPPSVYLFPYLNLSSIQMYACIACIWCGKSIGAPESQPLTCVNLKFSQYLIIGFIKSSFF